MAAVPAEMPVDVHDLGVEVQILLGHRAAIIPSPARATQRPMEQFPRSAIRIRYRRLLHRDHRDSRRSIRRRARLARR